MTTRNLRIIIIGAGLIGPRHAQSVVSHPSTDLIAFIDPSPSAIPVAESFGVPVYTSLQVFLSSSSAAQEGRAGAGADAAVICTPNHTHIPISLDLLRNGIKNILLEKPFSDTLESANALLHSLKDHPSAKILVGHHRRFNPYTLSAKSLLDSGSLGNILAINGLWTLLKPPSYFASPTGQWRADKTKGGVLGINLIHDIDVLQFLLGPIIRVFAESTTPQRIKGNPKHTAEEGCAVTLRFKSGVVGTVLVCDAAPSPLNFETGTGENPTIPGVDSAVSASDCYRVFGSRGSLSFPDLTVWSYNNNNVRLKSGQEKEQEKGWNVPLDVQKAPVGGKDVKPFDKQWEHFVRVCKGEEEVKCSVEDGVRALKVVRGVRESMESGRPVEIPVDG
ncbi:Gfo/Idh/MocA family protein [Aspergillus undulatus]|uniref:Gfo/Idh/MocA family protein n=1 Tax=Aspergillus undulatus TaxID=1810928 RepID=UPI003CCD1685